MSRKYKYERNSNFFRKPSRKMWYVVGIMAGDGNVSSRSNCVSLEWSSKDIDHLITIKNFFSLEIPYQERIRKEKYKSARFSIYDSTIKNDLIELGVTPNKSLTLTYPNHLDDKYFWHFLRGVFDSDGSIYATGAKIKYPRFQITGSKDLLDSFAEKIEDLSGINVGKVSCRKTNNQIADITCTGMPAMQLLKIMYKNSTEELRLPRKFEKYSAWRSDPRYKNL